MKHLIFVVCASLMLTSCAKLNQVLESNISIADLPAAVAESVSSNYPDAVPYSATKIEHGETDYIVTLNTQEEIAFRADGTCQGDGSGMRGERGRPDGMPGFDRNGMMGGHRDGDHDRPGRGGHGCGNHRGHAIPIDSLSGTIKAYLAANYAAYTLHHAETDTLCSVGATISVAARQVGAEPIRLFFDAATGNFVMRGERTKYADIPAAVTAYITANYTGYSNRIRAIKLTLADGSVQYTVFLHKKDMPRKAVTLKEDGSFICEK